MLFSRIVSFLTLGAMVFATPTPKAEPELDKRQLDLGSALSILNTLESTLSGSSTSALPLIGGLNLGSLTSTLPLTSLIAEVVVALETATTGLSLLGSLGGLGLEKRDDVADFASSLAGITTSIADTLGPLQGNSDIAIFSGLLGEVDVALKGLLVEAGVLVPGILATVAGLVSAVIGVLEGLFFTLTTGVLGAV